MRIVFFAPLMGNLNKSKGTIGTPSLAYNNLVPDQHPIYLGGQHTLAFITKCVAGVMAKPGGKSLAEETLQVETLALV